MNLRYTLRQLYTFEKHAGDIDPDMRLDEQAERMAGHYKLGCSHSLSPTLLDENSPIRMLMQQARFDISLDSEPTLLTAMGWGNATPTNDSAEAFFETVVHAPPSPATEVFLTDMNDNGTIRNTVGQDLAELFRSESAYLSAHDTGAGNSVLLVHLFEHRTYELA